MDVNWVAVLVGGVINMVVGALWYSPLLFAKPWMESLGLSDKKLEEMKKQTNMGKTYGIMFVGALIMAYVMAMLVQVTNTTMLDTGAMLGFWMWLGFIAPTMLAGVLFEQKPLKWYFVSSGYYLVVLVLVGALLAVWR